VVAGKSDILGGEFSTVFGLDTGLLNPNVEDEVADEGAFV